jgi:hypothetical protein
MIEQKYLEFFTQHLHADAVRHGARSLLAHLEGTHDLLHKWNNRDPICVAGLFHSIYGTWHFHHRSFPIDRRDIVRDLIGEEAELLAYIFCVTRRPEEFLSNAGAPIIALHDLATDETIEISPARLTNLLEIEAANYLEQKLNNRKVLKQLRDSDISAAARHDIDVRLQSLPRERPRIDAEQVQVRNAQIQQVRRTVLFDICRFMLKENHSVPSLEASVAQEFLNRPAFRRWIARAGCLEIYNKLYIHDPHITSLYSKLDEFLVSATSDVVGHIFGTTGIRPIIFKGVEILREYAPHPVGSTGDLDLVVYHPHFRRACDTLRDQGWVQGHYQDDRGLVPYAPEVIRRFEEGHYETVPFAKVFELTISGEERARIAAFVDGTFFWVVEAGQRSIKFAFRIDMHWGYLSNLRSDTLKLKASVFPFAETLDDSDHLYLMLLRNYYEATKQTGKLKNLVVSLLLMERGSVDWRRIRRRAIADGREVALAANVCLLEKVSPDLACVADPEGELARYRPDDAGMEMFFNSLIRTRPY